MEMELRYLPEKNIIWAEISGETTFRSVQQSAIEGLHLAKEHNCNSYLIDISRANIKYSIADAVIFIKGLNKMGFSNSDTVAFVISSDKKEKSFWETAALNRGWRRLAYFTEEAEAEKWLKDRATR